MSWPRDVKLWTRVEQDEQKHWTAIFEIAAKHEHVGFAVLDADVGSQSHEHQ